MSKRRNESTEQFYQRGLTGLTNLGNTCFMNTAIQCLSHSIPLTWYFIRNIDNNPELAPVTYQSNSIPPEYFKDLHPNPEKVEDETRVLHEYYRLLRGLWKKNGIVEPKSFHFSIQHLAIKKNNSQFGSGGQNDVHEFLIFLIDNMHTALERAVNINITGEPKTQLDQLALQAARSWKNFFKDKYSIFVDLFYGQYVSYIEAVEEVPKPEQSFNYDPFCVVSIELPPSKHNLSLIDCLQHFSQEEMLEGDTKWYSERDNCHKVAKKKVMFWSTPTLLIVHLKRFSNLQHKRNDHVDIPFELNLEPFCIGYDKFSSKYKLYAVANHTGSQLFGHYYSFCQNQNGEWHVFDDDQVRPIDKSQVVTPHAYCLFYQKIKV